MASEKIKLGINLRKNTNSKSLAFGKYYPEVDQQKTLSLRGFAQYMVDHGSSYARGKMPPMPLLGYCKVIAISPMTTSFDSVRTMMLRSFLR